MSIINFNEIPESSKATGLHVNPEPSEIFNEKSSLKCKVCNKELLDDENKGIIISWQRLRTDFEKEPQHF